MFWLALYQSIFIANTLLRLTVMEQQFHNSSVQAKQARMACMQYNTFHTVLLYGFSEYVLCPQLLKS
jgi:hypothetical protein